jgi:hypothetical protein
VSRRPGEDRAWFDLRALGLQMVLPAMVCGAVFGSLFDMLLGLDGWPMTKAGVIAGAGGFALAINGLERAARRERRWEIDLDAYRRAETARRLAAAKGRGELVRFKR